MNSISQDVRYAVHRFARAPGFVLVVTLLLALGTGANTALFTVANALLLQARPGVHDAARLYWIELEGVRSPFAQRVSYAELVAMRDATSVFDGVAGFNNSQFSMGGSGDPERVAGQVVTGNLFAVLRASVAFGRPLSSADDRVGAPPVAVIGDGLWHRRFHGDSAVIGTTITVNAQPVTIVGVAPRYFTGAALESEECDIWLPVVAWMSNGIRGTNLVNDHSRWLRSIVRLRDGATVAKASAVANTVLSRATPADSAAARFSGVRLHTAAVGLSTVKEAGVLPLAVFCVAITLIILVIACANVSNLLLSRGIVRRREIAVRLAIGASRGRVVRQLLIESGLLAVIGGSAGLLFASWSVDAVVAFNILPVPIDMRIDARVIAAAVLVSTFATVLMGIVPAFDATRDDVSSALKSGVGGLDRRRAGLQGRLVIAQVSLSILLLCTAALFLNGLRKEQAFAMGFDTSASVLAISFDPNQLEYSDDRRARLASDIRAAVVTLPGVLGAAYTDELPMGDLHVFESLLIPSDSTATIAQRATGREMSVFRSVVDPGYLSLIQIPLVAGRDFSTADDHGAPGAAIVSEAFARRAWPGLSPLGRPLRVGPQRRLVTVVGVARDAYVTGMEAAPRSLVYFPRLQYASGFPVNLVVRSTGDAGALVPRIRQLVRAIDANLPVFRAQTMAQYRRNEEDKSRDASALLLVFGALALLLASVGMYAVIAFAVGQRQHEIGVRISLGATSGDVVRLFVRRAFRLIAIGAAIGVALALVAGKLLVSTLLGLTFADTLTVIFAIGALLPALFIASWLPARRAVAVDPSRALRDE